MVKKIVLVVALLAVGVAIAMYLRGGGTSARPVQQTFTPRTGASDAERIADLEKTVAAQVDRINLLESRLGELDRAGRAGNRRNADGSTDPRADRGADLRRQLTDANGNFDPSRIRDLRRQQEKDRLVQAGFSPDRADWIDRRSQELQYQNMQAQYEAQSSGQPAKTVDVNAELRKEMGDAEYEKYLKAEGRSTSVQVMDVLASSPAEKAGLKPGDQIVSYGGQRVYDTSDLNTLSRQGTPGETVTVEVQRDGQTVQVQVPRGVLGVQGGGGPRGGGFPGGGPGGFRGGGRPPG